MSLPHTRITDTDVAVSAIGLGTVKFGRNTGVKYPQAFDLPTDAEILKLLDVAWENGINLIDTAPAYGTSEQRLGALLAQHKQDWIIATKAGESFDPATGASHYDFSRTALTDSIHNSLRQLRREQLDIVLIHSDGNDLDVIERHGALDTLTQLKQQGLIRAIGMSTKTVAGGLRALEQSDIVMVMHNANYNEEQTVIEHATLTGKSIFIKKALASGHLNAADKETIIDPVKNHLNAIFQHPAVASVVMGTLNPKHLSDNIAKAETAILAP